MIVSDENFYPAPFGKFEVVSTDANGNPTKTKFFDRDDHSKHIFSWQQTWNESGKCITWELTELTA